jgi:hypothetical protein
VTESYLYNLATAENISAWIIEVEEQASQKGFKFTDHTELFLQLDGNDCNYYFVDHEVRTLFWLDAYDTSELGILPVVSSSHLSKPNLFDSFHGILIFFLGMLLEAQYWTHIENFCMHIGGLPLKTIDDLIDTFSHALLGKQILFWFFTFKPHDAQSPITIDNLTSTQSTFPYNSTDCEKFRSLLISSRGKRNAKFLHRPGLTPFS